MAYPMCAEITKKERSIMKHVKKPELRALIRFELVQPGMHSMVKIVHMSAGYAIMASYKMTV